MNFTYRNNLWKGEATNSIVPSNSRPFNKYDANSINRTPFKANPLKQWRKQLMPYYKTLSTKQITIDQIEAPNSSIYVDYKLNNIDCSDNNYKLLKENITLLNDCLGIKDISNNTCKGGSFNIKRSGTTLLNKNYYNNNSKYLQNKCKLYEQNKILGDKIKSNTYKCTNSNTVCQKEIIYKPSNNAFMTQGAVSSSANILRKKNIALTRNHRKGNTTTVDECSRTFHKCKKTS